VLGHVRRPIATWSPGEPFVLPAIEHPGTLVLHDVNALSIHEQGRLLDWSNDGRRKPQVISTTPTPLLPLVLAATFMDTLYYRLNTVLIDLTASDRASQRN
jgi:DNA-binding NtrC family response regulator